MPKISLLEIVVVLYCGWQSYSLFQSWGVFSTEYYSWIPFLIWCLPLLIYLFLPSFCIPKEDTSYPLLATAIAFSFLGTIGSLNTLHYFSFAIALAAIPPPTYWKLIWIILAISWMPGFGWYATYHLQNLTLLFRILLAAGTAALMSSVILKWRNS